MKKLISCFLSIVVLLSVIPNIALAKSQLPLNLDFASETLGAVPAGIESVIEDGSVTVEDYYGTRMIYIKNNSDGKLAQVSKNFDEVSNTVLNVRFRYMQRYAKQDDAIIFALTNGTEEVMKIKSSGSDIVNVSSGGATNLLVEKYSANKWYDFEFEINLKEKTYTVAINGIRRKNLAFYKNLTSCDGIKFATSYSPGFALANIAVATGEQAERVEINGPDTMSIKKLTGSEYVFDAVLYDDFGNIVKDATYEWTVTPQNKSGITVVPDGDELKIKIGTDASYKGVVTIAVTANPAEEAISAVKYVNLIGQDVSKIEFVGPHKLAYGIEPDNTFVLDTEMYSKDNELLDNEAVDWQIKNPSSDVVITKEDSRLIFEVRDELPNRTRIDVKAILKSNRTVTKDWVIYTYPKSVYEGDQSRMNFLLESVDYLINDLAKNEFNDAPLIPSYLNLKTLKPEAMDTMYQGKVYSTDLAINSGMYKVLDGLTLLTGDKTYRELTEATYQWYLDNGIDEKSNLGYWGGHCQINLETLEPTFSNMSPTTYYHYHELKDHGFYWDPFFRLNEGRATELVHGLWNSHVYDWDQLFLNRHGEYFKTGSDGGNWEYAYDFEPLTEPSRRVDGVGFRSFTNDLAESGAVLYKYTGDENAKRWAYNAISSFYSLRDPDTHMQVSQFTIAHRAPGVKDPDAVFPGWWKTDSRDIAATGSYYGDRFYNQFANDLIAQGYYSEADRKTDKMTEPHMAQMAENAVLSDFNLAQVLGDDTEEGRALKKYATQHIAGYIRSFWRKGSTVFDKGMIDGTILSDFVPTRNGYMGTNYYGYNNKYGTSKITNIYALLAACKSYIVACEYPELAEDAQVLKEFIDYYAEKVFKIGKVGENVIGDEGTDLNMAATNSDAYMIIALLELYKASQNNDFLDLARTIAGNYFNKYYTHNVLFTPNAYIPDMPSSAPGGKYLYMFGGSNYLGYYALMALEATLCGVENEIPDFHFFDGYYSQYAVNAGGGIEDTNDRTWINSTVLPHVYISKVSGTKEITLNPGESFKLDLKYYPEDYTDGVNLSYINPAKDIVHFNEKTSSIEAKSAGETELTFYIGAKRIEHKIKVTVKE